jgi:N-acyl-D-aspartate/D-glutamate deacylase
MSGRHWLTLEDAVRKMTAFPAARLGLSDRVVLRPGLKADIAVFDPATVRDTATYAQPHQYAEGVRYVIVNGEIGSRRCDDCRAPGKGPVLGREAMSSGRGRLFRSITAE